MSVNILSKSEFDEIIDAGPFPIRLPHERLLDQDEEWCMVYIGSEWRKIRFHDYREVYRIPGLYETIFYRTLRCHSPHIVVNCLKDVIIESKLLMQDLRVIDFGAGNGMVGEALQNAGTRHIIGVDILEEAKIATLRDRPWVYDDFVVADFTQLTDHQSALLHDFRANALIVVAALGFGDIPPQAFINAFNFVEQDGWLAFNIKENFLRTKEKDTFAALIEDLLDAGIIRMHSYRRCRHRFNIAGQPLYYATIVAQKVKQMSE